MNYETILFKVENRIATITLNRPDRLNAWNHTMSAELGHAMLCCDEDDEIRAVVVTGAGRAFCAGSDLSSGDSAFDTFSREKDTVLRDKEGRYEGYAGPFPWQIRKPVFAAINGHAIGVGITYPMTCDLRIVAEDAKVQFAFVRRGVLPELWSHKIVPQVAGLSNAADLLLTGRMIRGRELVELGLASAALPADQVLEATLERAREVLKAAPVSVAISKRLLWRGLSISSAELGPKEALMFAWTSSQADAREGVASFLEKRDPDWKLSVAKNTPEIGL
ncbi:MAG: enoyl-CoA hydratase/isomerase family protein [Proteobacteria bacterium]|nr:enoyl-CoA hydratase/isomerase family protein [Desulfobacterales bacterium]MBL7102580.1 enoyl-CoA hydratase/isomerase family protein [Desulfobacteraceae bacterium]MBL7172798.1 enoyl-CoA hydratase/isomerase family protein [Desulfobacteraceae bacterium]MBU0736330.1 enoyl-CoA hydratase/isomerase family protein [Pseudomonadota bacterium]MBU1902336.1 enoyl-CoA hydratase/isomerase family protein [Pseudomonadota bacterium]